MVNESEYTRRIYLGGWIVFQSDDGEYLYIDRAGAKPGRMRLKANEEGLVAELLVQDSEVVSDALCGLWSDLEPIKAKGKHQQYE